MKYNQIKVSASLQILVELKAILSSIAMYRYGDNSDQSLTRHLIERNFLLYAIIK